MATRDKVFETGPEEPRVSFVVSLAVGVLYLLYVDLQQHLLPFVVAHLSDFFEGKKERKKDEYRNTYVQSKLRLQKKCLCSSRAIPRIA